MSYPILLPRTDTFDLGTWVGGGMLSRPFMSLVKNQIKDRRVDLAHSYYHRIRFYLHNKT